MKHVYILLRHSRENGSIQGVEAVIEDEGKAYNLLLTKTQEGKGKVLFSLEYKAVTPS